MEENRILNKAMFLVGPHACGKTFSANSYINKEIQGNVVTIDSGPIMRKLHKESKSDYNISQWVNQLEQNYGKNITSLLIKNEIQKIIVQGNYDKAIVIGFRTIESIRYIIRKFNIKDFSILYVDACNEMLYNNYLEREKQCISFNEFTDYLNLELKSGLINLKNLAKNKEECFDYYFKEINSNELEYKISDFFNS